MYLSPQLLGSLAAFAAALRSLTENCRFLLFQHLAPITELSVSHRSWNSLRSGHADGLHPRGVVSLRAGCELFRLLVGREFVHELQCQGFGNGRQSVGLTKIPEHESPSLLTDLIESSKASDPTQRVSDPRGDIRRRNPLAAASDRHSVDAPLA